MKQVSRVLIVLLALGSILISACGAATPGAAAKVAADEVAFTGVIEGMDGTQWVVNGQTITVDPSVVRDGPFNVGDTIKIEGIVNSDGSLTVARVEPATTDDLSTLPQLGDDNSNDANSNDDNSNDANFNDDNSNGDNSNDANFNDDNGNDDVSNNVNDANVNDDDDDNANVNGDDDNGNDDDDDNGNGNGNDNRNHNDNSDDEDDDGDDDDEDDD
jgi:hypothetical protein